MGALVDSTGKAVQIEGLWAIVAGPTGSGTAAVSPNATGDDLSQTLFFTAGPVDEVHGLMGTLQAAP